MCVLLSVQPSFAAYDMYSDAFDKKMKLLTKDAAKLADNIAAYNKPVFEAKLTRKEREYTDFEKGKISISPITWNRVFAKDKTLVISFTHKDGTSKAYFMKTTEPDFSFHGLHVGSDIKAIEKFFGAPINNISYKIGTTLIIYGPSYNGPYYVGENFLDATVNIRIKNGRITEINYDVGGDFDDSRGGTLSRKAVDFAERQARQMGLSSINGGLPVYFDWSSGRLVNIQ